MLMTFGALALAAALTTPRAVETRSLAPAADTLRVVLVVDDTVLRRSLLRGALLGAEEASHTGALFATVVTLRVQAGTIDDVTLRAAQSGAADGAALPSLYLVAGDARVCSQVMLQGARAGVPVLDAGCATGDSARAINVYSLIPADDGGVSVGDSTRLALWHWSLERFGAEQLNERFRRRFDARMDSPAWTGWLALKIALDAALHAHATSGPALLRQFADPRTRYDGQKGRPLRFAPGTRRLVQPVYRVAGRGDAERVIAEVIP